MSAARMLLRTAWFVAVLAADATVGAAWAWCWAAGYEPDICDDDYTDYFAPEGC